ncbi:hypothetical protein [Succinivibrio dextrinosolvens]|uniref:hypothetical protein n=1 Tax=Succinivibrio dextrinosolvens TaxID=83771 RepID=UPI00247A3C8A|nr:hypothetical protein [Succinivibrio dextrinosolvens]
MEDLIIILLLLAVIAVVLNQFNYRLALCMFPDTVKVTKWQGLLGWYGWVNLFVALPFLWDGDFSQGMYPLILGLIPAVVSIFTVLKFNDDRNVELRRDSKVCFNDNGDVLEPCNDVYGYLNNYSQRMKAIGPKYFFKEIFAREKSNKTLADGLLENTPEVTVDTLKSLPWVLDGAVDVKAQYIFLLEFMTSRYDNKKLYENLKVFCEKSKAIAKLLEIKFNAVPYNIAKFIAEADLTVSLMEKTSSDYSIAVDGESLENSEKILYVSTSPMYKINQNLSPVFRAIVAKFAKLTSKDEGTIILTSKKIIVKTPYSKSDFPISDAVFSFGDDISFDNSNYFCVLDTNFFRFVMLNLNKTL